MLSTSKPYIPPNMRNKRQKNENVINKNKDFDITKNADLFPELSSSISNNNINSQQTEQIDNTKTFSHLIKNNTQPEKSNNTNFSDGWIEITEKDTRKMLASRNSKQISNKPDFIQRIYKQERYIRSLSDREYSQLCHKTMNDVANIYKRQRLEFIQMHGYEYYDSIYGYEPSYNRRRVVCRYIPKTDKNYDSDSQLFDQYIEYCTDDDEWDIDSVKDDDVYFNVDDTEDDYND